MKTTEIYSHVNNLKQQANYLALAGSIAHEMRNVLNQCQYGIEGIAQELGDFQQEVQKLRAKSLSSISGGNQLISIILNNIKHRAIDKQDFTELSIQECVQKALRGYCLDNVHDKVEVSPGDFIFKGEAHLMEYTFYNLLKNALWHLGQKKDGKIKITIEKGEHVNSLYFEDNGPGIPKSKCATVFENFMTDDKLEGTGLGLPFCKNAMTSFGGDIEVESKVGEYTKFILCFPRCSH